MVQTSAKVGTNPYGKPAMEFTYAGGVEGIARALADMLAEDMERHFNRELYESHALKIAPHQYREQQTETVSPRQAHNGIGQVRNTELSGQTVLRQHGNEEIAQENLATERGGIGREQKQNYPAKQSGSRHDRLHRPWCSLRKLRSVYSTTSRRTLPISIRSGRS